MSNEERRVANLNDDLSFFCPLSFVRCMHLSVYYFISAWQQIKMLSERNLIAFQMSASF